MQSTLLKSMIKYHKFACNGNTNYALEVVQSSFDDFMWLHNNCKKCVQSCILQYCVYYNNLKVADFVYANYPEYRCELSTMFEHAALTNKIDFIKWAKNKIVSVDDSTAIDNATLHGHVKIVKILHSIGFRCSTKSIYSIRLNSYPQMRKWILDNYIIYPDPTDIIKSNNVYLFESWLEHSYIYLEYILYCACLSIKYNSINILDRILETYSIEKDIIKYIFKYRRYEMMDHIYNYDTIDIFVTLAIAFNDMYALQSVLCFNKCYIDKVNLMIKYDRLEIYLWAKKEFNLSMTDENIIDLDKYGRNKSLWL